MTIIKNTIRRIIRRGGFDIIRFNRDQIGVYPFIDMQRLLNGHTHPVIFDVGANVGQSVHKFRDAFPSSCIHSFEPSPSTYEQLKTRYGTLPGVNVWNFGIGSIDTQLVLKENEHSDMSSFLNPSVFAWGKIVKSTSVEVTTLDLFAKKHDINFIHILKSDTQGFDFEVFKGASHLIEDNRIAIIYFEVIFSDMYENIPPFYDVFRYLCERNFSLVTFYSSRYQKNLISETDALFINRKFDRKRVGL